MVLNGGWQTNRLKPATLALEKSIRLRMSPATSALCVLTVMLGLVPSVSPTNIIMDRSSKNLSSVPKDLPKTLELLDLSRNHIQQLLQGDFEETGHLRFLNVSWNALVDIDPLTFLSTPLLESLDLSHNKLKNLSGQAYLLHTGNLLALNLVCNTFHTMKLGDEFGSLVKLETLALGASNISLDDFKTIAGLELRTLSLFLERKSVYDDDALADVHARKLQIVFNWNRIRDYRTLVKDALSLFEEVEFMNLANGYQDLQRQLTSREQMHTKSLYLTNITIPWLALTNFVNGVLRTSIAHLDASDVILTHLPYHDTVITKPSNMESFSARRAKVNGFFFSQEAVYNFFINLPVKSVAITESPIIHMTCPGTESPIRQLDFSNCAMSNSIFSRVEGQETLECKTLSNVTDLILTGNSIKSLQILSKRIQHMKSLQNLDLSINSLEYNGLEKCLWPQSLTIMTLSSNELTELVFNCLPKGLTTLDLNNNQVSVVPSPILELKNLVSLNLNSNRLRDLPVCDSFPQLGVLRLRSNSLYAPSVSRLTSCFKLKVLDMSYNPFICTCPLRDLISLGYRSENKNSHTGIELVNWPWNYYCTYPVNARDTTLREISIPAVSCNVGFLAASILCPAIIVIITVMSLCHHFDVIWYMRMIWKWTRAKHRTRMRQVRPEDLVGVEFHAFVSYSQHDAEWVKESLLPNLEGPGGGLRICHHEKDFVPGKTIIQNIIACVEKSRRSVFVLSAHFVKSDWCHYELYFASHQRLSRGSDSIVLVLLEPLPQYLIPSKYYQLKAMMRRHTYLEWPQEKAKQRLFWANLRAALQADLPDAQVTELEE